MSSYLLKKSTSPYYYARLKVPKQLRGFIGKREFVESLKTSNLSEAKKKSVQLVNHWLHIIETAKKELELSPEARYIKLLEQASAIRSQSVSGIEPIPEEVISNIAEELNAPLPIQKKFYQVATGVYSPLEIGGWSKSISKLGSKTQFEYTKLVTAFIEEFKYIENLKDKKRLRQYVANGPTKTLGAINNYLKYLLNQGDLEDLPTAGFSKPKASTKLLKEDFTVAEIKKLNKAVIKLDNQPLHDLFTLGIYTGARIEELCRLTINDVELISGVKHLSISKSKTSSGIRKIPIHSELLPVVQRLVKEADKDKFLIKTDAVNKFGSRSGSLSKHFGRLKKSLGFTESKSFHSIRRTVATLFEQSEVPELVAASILGHKFGHSMSYGLYSGGASVPQKVDAISKLEYGL